MELAHQVIPELLSTPSLCCVFCSVVSVMTDSATQGTVAHQPPLSMEFSRQEYWSGLPCPSSRGCSQATDPTHVSCVSCIAGGFFATEPSGNFIAYIQSLTMSAKWMFVSSKPHRCHSQSNDRDNDNSFPPQSLLPDLSCTLPSFVSHPSHRQWQYDHKACHIKFLSGSPYK